MMLAWTTKLAGIRHETLRVFTQAVTGSVRRFCRETDEFRPKERNTDEFPETTKHVVDDFEDLIQTEDDRKLVHLILLEIECLRDESARAPWNVPQSDMSELLRLNYYARKRYYGFMFKKQAVRFSEKLKKARKRAAAAEMEKEDKPIAPANKIHAIIRDRTQYNQTQGLKLMNEALFGQKLLFDCSFEKNMTRREAKNCAKQMLLIYSDNKSANKPFDLTFCGLNPSGYLHSCIKEYFIDYDSFPFLIDLTEKSYLDLVPKEKLVYLTPDAPTVLNEWDHDAQYIIGALVDLGNQLPLTFARAKEEGLRCERFPLQEKLVLKPGQQKALPLNIVVNVLLKFRETNDWKQAFKELPSRTLVGEKEQAEMMAKRQLKTQTYQKLVRRKNKMDFRPDQTIRRMNSAWPTNSGTFSREQNYKDRKFDKYNTSKRTPFMKKIG